MIQYESRLLQYDLMYIFVNKQYTFWMCSKQVVNQSSAHMLKRNWLKKWSAESFVFPLVKHSIQWKLITVLIKDVKNILYQDYHTYLVLLYKSSENINKKAPKYLFLPLTIFWTVYLFLFGNP